ncbi:MAG: hypothetical protein HY664_00470 [Chloroflexi bacterium]|nr:hypothetical protein [Chloroflexota bacterium]
MVVSRPRLAGKTTLLNALLDFLRPEIKPIYLRGRAEDFSFVGQADPSRVYMVAAEISDHLPFYTWGEKARRAFELLSQGYSLGATMHAGSAREAVEILRYQVGVPLEHIIALDLVVTISIAFSGGRAAQLARRIEEVGLVEMGKDDVSIQTLASWKVAENSYTLQERDALAAVLEARFGLRHQDVGAKIDMRQRVLARVEAAGHVSRDEVREAILEFYKSSAV